MASFFWPGPPGAQPVGDLQVAKLALLVAGNGFISPSSYLRRCCDDDGPCFVDGAGERCLHLANLVTAMLGLALVLGQMAFFSAAAFRPQAALVTVAARWTVSLAKLATVGTLQLWVYVFCLCLKMLCIRY
ncbi:hypothetical protein OsI_29468 [Oryza sativa Indica Group]|jgi:hypothetical protein|uniref:Uncharacterized protein n=2 Tax=Oryza TaxID=4527 RepID=A0A0E0ICY1_ORYNI|nr:hypothetical protein OsI_29468 [Oryza sativa Indica Group]